MLGSKASESSHSCAWRRRLHSLSNGGPLCPENEVVFASVVRVEEEVFSGDRRLEPQKHRHGGEIAVIADEYSVGELARADKALLQPR